MKQQNKIGYLLPGSVDGRSWITDAKRSLRANLGFGVPVMVYVAIALTVASTTGGMRRFFLLDYAPLFILMTVVMVIAFLLGRAFYVTLIVIPPRPFAAIVADWSFYLTRRRIFDTVLVMVLLSTFMSAFISLKNMIPIVHPYNWDRRLMTVDNALHFGIPPWRLLQPILGYPIVTGMLSVVYGSWIFVLAGCCFWLAFDDGDQRLRMQFFVTFILCFALLGNLLATRLASGGPCFYGLLVDGPDPYSPLMHYLRLANQQVPLNWSFAAQDMLWHNYATGSLGLDTGISAMPSLHVAGATLCSLLGWRINRKLGITFSVYTGLIMIGSVHLAWHYAIDGYVAIIGTLAIWWAVGKVSCRFGMPRWPEA